MAHAQKRDFVFRRNGRVHLNRRGRQFSRLLAAEVCASAVVMLDTPCSEVVWRVLATHSIRQFPLHFPSRASHCSITFQLESTRTGLEGPRGSGGIALLFLHPGTRWGWMVNASTQPLNPWEKPGTDRHRGGLEVAENLAHTGIRSLDRPSRNKIEVQFVSNSMHHNPSWKADSFSASRISQNFMEPEVSLLCSHKPATSPHPEPD